MTWSETFSMEKALQALEAEHASRPAVAGGEADDDVYAQELRGLLRELDQPSAFGARAVGKFNRAQPGAFVPWMEEQP